MKLYKMASAVMLLGLAATLFTAGHLPPQNGPAPWPPCIKGKPTCYINHTAPRNGPAPLPCGRPGFPKCN